jgi:hypothetical protein
MAANRTQGSLTFYVGEGQAGANQIRSRLNAIASAMGFGLAVGKGGAARLIEALADGRVVPVAVDPEDREWLVGQLRVLAAKHQGANKSVIERLARSLELRPETLAADGDGE